MIGGSDGRLSLIRKLSLCPNPPKCSVRRAIPPGRVRGLGLCWQRLFARSHGLALEHLHLDFTRSNVTGSGLRLVSRRTSEPWLTNRSLQLQKYITQVKQRPYKPGYSSPPRFRKLTVNGLNDEPFLKELRGFLEPGVQLIVDDE